MFSLKTVGSGWILSCILLKNFEQMSKCRLDSRPPVWQLLHLSPPQPSPRPPLWNATFCTNVNMVHSLWHAWTYQWFAELMTLYPGDWAVFFFVLFDIKWIINCSIICNSAVYGARVTREYLWLSCVDFLNCAHTDTLSLRLRQLLILYTFSSSKPDGNGVCRVLCGSILETAG